MISERNRRHAQEMRRMATPAERALWQGLRRRNLGVRFRRQFPIGPFILDFYCHTARLVIEVDGETHANAVADSRRDRWLNQRGLKVLRFWNNEVLENLDGVLRVIAAEVEAVCGPVSPFGDCPLPSPSPAQRVRGIEMPSSPLPEREGMGEGLPTGGRWREASA